MLNQHLSFDIQYKKIKNRGWRKMDGTVINESRGSGESYYEECLSRLASMSANQRDSSVPAGLSNLLPGQAR